MIQNEGKQTISENLSGSKIPSIESFGFISSMGISGTDWLEVPTIYIHIWWAYIIPIWLVVWNIFYFSIYWECHHPNWRTHIFQRGQPDMFIFVRRTWVRLDVPVILVLKGWTTGKPSTQVPSKHTVEKDMVFATIKVDPFLRKPWVFHIELSVYLRVYDFLRVCAIVINNYPNKSNHNLIKSDSNIVYSNNHPIMSN